jgi:hypothetical protein
VATYLALEGVEHAGPTVVDGTTHTIISTVKSFIHALAEGLHSPTPDLPGHMASGCVSLVAAALRFERKIKSQIVLSDYRVHCYQNGDIMPTSYLRFLGEPPRLDSVRIMWSISLGLTVSEADGDGKLPKADWLRRVEVAIEQDFT